MDTDNDPDDESVEEAYRNAARRLHPEMLVEDDAFVSTCPNGAFVDASIWVEGAEVAEFRRDRAVSAHERANAGKDPFHVLKHDVRAHTTMFLDDVIPAPRPHRPRPRHDAKNTKLVVVDDPGPWEARILRFTGPFWERIGGTTPTPYYRSCAADDEGAIARMRVHCVFERLQASDGTQLVLSSKFRASRDPSSAFAQLVAGLAQLPADDIATTDLDLNAIVDRRVNVTLKPDHNGFARIALIAPFGSTISAYADS